MKKILNHLFEHKTLSRSEAEEVLTRIASGVYSESEIAAFLTVYLMRSITVEELSGFRDALLNLCHRVDLSGMDIIDVCGTGGDGKDTFNISTLCTFIVAGAGGRVAKHGNYAVSSSSGSSNILEHAGYHFSTDSDKLMREIDETGVCFLHAPLFNPAMKNVAPVRRALKIKTFFNMLGPTVNPAMPKKQLVGVYSLELARLYNYLYQQSDIRCGIVHSLDGYDEVSLTSEFKFILDGVEQLVTPAEMGYSPTLPEDLSGGNSVDEASAVFMNILSGKGTRAQNDVVLANAELALRCYYPEKPAADCHEMAKESLSGGKALAAFKKLIALQ